MFLDQRLALLLKSLMDHCVDGASFLGAKASTLWRQLVRGWFTVWGRPVPYAYEKALDTQELDRKYALVLSDTPEQMEPESIPAGTVLESKVYGCMYPFMNCKNQRYMANHLCQDDGYWIRRIHDFNCSGGFIAAKAGEAAKWKYVDHFALSAVLLLFVVVIGIFARSYAISQNRDMDRRFWWMHHLSRNEEEEGKEIIQITL